MTVSESVGVQTDEQCLKSVDHKQDQQTREKKYGTLLSDDLTQDKLDQILKYVTLQVKFKERIPDKIVTSFEIEMTAMMKEHLKQIR